MLKTEIDSGNGDGGSTGGCNSWGRVCDTCRSATCTIYCRDDTAFLCSGCDARIHAANGVASRHERVYVCEACERAPADFICKADAASLCTACDMDVHEANPLSRRHHRVPILPISGCIQCPRASNVLIQDRGEENDEEDEVEAASWLLLNPVKNNSCHNNFINNNQANEFLFGGEEEEYLNLIEFNSRGGNQLAEEQYNNQQQQYSNMANKNFGGDSIVPFQLEIKEKLHRHNQNVQQSHEYDASESGFRFVDHSISISSMDVGVVPETTPSDDASVSHPRQPRGTIDLFVGPPIQIPAQLSPVDREARVLRYREKKKSRKFEKTIRYASRKAYAETRPRIKGRFAKRTDTDIEAEHKFLTPFTSETTGYGLVPSY